jgi:3-oxoadipate CoA-transferase, alpha subunit
MDKRYPGPDEALADIGDGATIMVGGFGDSGFPHALVAALARKAPGGLTLIHNGAGFGRLISNKNVRKLICSYPIGPSSIEILPLLEQGYVELEVIPQGTLVERIRAGGAALGGVLTPVGLDLGDVDAGSVMELDGRRYLLARPLRAQFALLSGRIADHFGNVQCHLAGRNFNPVMATAADVVIVQVEECVAPGDLDPECIHIPAPFIDRVVVAPKAIYRL